MKKVIARENLPTKMPVLLTAICWLLLDRLALPGWAQGVAWTLVGLLWTGAIIQISRESTVDLFKSGARDE